MTQVIKKRVAVASVLKTITDTRMFEKLGWSLAVHTAAEVHIVGFPAEEAPEIPNIIFHPVFRKPFGRLSFKRIITPWKILGLLLKIKPQTVIITTHELLIAGCLYKFLTGARLFYDVQENYFCNIRFTPAFPRWLRLPLSTWVRFKERLLAPAIECFFLAEKGYEAELMFARPCMVLENKFPERMVKPVAGHNRLRLLFTGTLAPTTGVLQAVDLAVQLHKLSNGIDLTIVGHAPQYAFLRRLKAKIAAHAFIHLEASLYPIPHRRIIRAIENAGTGIIIYPPNPSTSSSVPTKLYEYLGMGIPVLIQHSGPSHDLVKRCRGGIVLSGAMDYPQILHELSHLQAPFRDASLYWESQIPGLLKVLGI